MANVRSFQVKFKKATLFYTSQGAAKSLFSLPPNARILQFMVDVRTAFNDSGTDLLDLGISGTGTYFATAVDLSLADQVVVQQSHLGQQGTTQVEIFATYTGQNADASAGEAEVSVLYADPYEE